MNSVIKISLFLYAMSMCSCFAMESAFKIPPARKSSSKRTFNNAFPVTVSASVARLPAQKKQRIMNKEERDSFLKAINGNNVDKVSEVLNKFYIDLNKPLFSSTTPLKIAVQRGHFNMVACLVAMSADCSTGYDGEFYVALMHKHQKIAHHLIESYAINVNRPIETATLKTPLHIAFEKKHLPLIKVLIQDNADVNLFDKEGYMPPAYLAKMDIRLESLHDMCEYLYGKRGILAVNSAVSNAGSTLLHEAVKNGNLPLVKNLIENYDAHTEVLDYTYKTPLMLAYALNKIEIIKYLESLEIG